MPLLLIFFFLFGGAGPANSPTPVTPPSPALTVSFERQSLRQKDCVNVELLISNESDLELTNVSLEVFGPSFFHWYDGRCEEKGKEAGQGFGMPATPALSLRSIVAASPFKHEVHVHTGSTIDVGEYNVLFSVPYEWKTGKQSGRSFVSAEKTVKVTFLGNESVAGIPLALAGFIIPGLIFWLIIRAFGASWSIDGISDQMIYSVMVSTALVVMGAWLKFWDVSTGISIEKLTLLAGVGAAIGLVAGSGDYVVRIIRKKRREAQQITDHEDEFSLLGKLLELPSANRLEKPTITTKNKEEYAGSLGSRTNIPGADGTPGAEVVYLVGSYKMNWGKIRDLKLKTSLQGLLEKKSMREFVRLASQEKALDTVDGVQLKDKDGNYNAIDDPFKQWLGADEVLSTTTGSISWTSETLDTN